ncbi:flagellar hook-length control protein FliK [Conexibacter woesei]|uniref:flagellar hook-length control protein FliK n=1 Tax=Conexibacter woesei TaxID=191495 RepID=UPI0003FD30BC|nr:flagellar hook-length control protein FliK [Conexibacter woesei]
MRSQHDDDAKPDATSRASDDASKTQSQPTAKDATDPDGSGKGAQQQAGQDADAQQQQKQGNPDANAAASTAAAAALALQATPLVPKGAGNPVVADGGVPGQNAQTQQAVVATDVAAQAALAAATDAKAAATGDGTPAGKLQLPAELLDAKGAGKHAAKGIKTSQGGAVIDGLPPAPTLAPTATAAAQAGAGAGAGQQGGAGNNPNNGAGAQAQPATPPTVAAGQPTATPLTAVPTASGMPQLTKGSVVQTAERVQELVRIATTRAGNARATLQLRPEALGQVDVQLRTTKDGLVATIAAHDQAGLDALQNAAGELKRTLEDRGVQLHSLDLQLGAGADSGFSNQGDARQASTGQGGRNASYGLDGEDADDELELTISRTPSIPAGELVDVTA